MDTTQELQLQDLLCQEQYFDDINREKAADVDATMTKYENLLEQLMHG